MRKQRNVSRRKFLQTSAAAGAAGMAFPYVVPNQVLAAPGRQGANDRIVIGFIGVGGRGGDHVRQFKDMGIRTGAVCDVDRNNMARAARFVGGNPFTTQDYRRLLERKDVDAVVISTPDHWHAIQMIDACQAGQDVYSEKPTCRTIQEGQAMINAQKKYNRVVQIGTQGRSEPAARACAQYVRNGQIGKVNYVDVWHPVNFSGNQAMTFDSAPPASLNWDMWLGPSRWRAFNRSIHPFNFRWFMEYGGGFIRDRGNHVLSCVFWAMGADNTGPVTVEAEGERHPRGVWDTPVTMRATWEFKDPDWKVTWSQPGQQRPFPERPDRLLDWGAQFFGDKGSVILEHGDGADTETKAKQYVPPSDGVTLPESPGKPDQRHQQNWLTAIKSRQDPIMPVAAGVAVVTLPIIANISFLLGRKLYWDPQKNRFVNDDDANRFLAEPYRAPYHL